MELSSVRALLLYPLLALGLWGQQVFKISTDVNLVVLGVTVLDGRGGFVSGLQKEDFRVYENARLQETTVFLPEDAPVSVGLVVDGSGSMLPKRAETIAAAQAFMQYSNLQDEMFVVHFNEDVSLGLAQSEPFTSSVDSLRKALFKLPASGRTALYDAIAMGLEHLKRGSREKRVLIVFSDGGDNSSRFRLHEILRMVEESNAIIYTIGLFDEADPDRNPGVLRRLARISGGKAYLPGAGVEGGRRDLAEICTHVARDIRNQYTIGYVPSAEGGARRSIKVLAETPDHRKLAVRTRTGYTAPIQAEETP